MTSWVCHVSVKRGVCLGIIIELRGHRQFVDHPSATQGSRKCVSSKNMVALGKHVQGLLNYIVGGFKPFEKIFVKLEISRK